MAGKNVSSSDLSKKTFDSTKRAGNKIDPLKLSLRKKLFSRESASKPSQAGEGSTKKTPEKRAPLKPAEVSAKASVQSAGAKVSVGQVRQGKVGEGPTKQATLLDFMKPRQSENKPASLRPEEKGKDQPAKKGEAGEGTKSDPPRRRMPLPLPKSASKSSDPSDRVESPTVAKDKEEARPKERKKSSANPRARSRSPAVCRSVRAFVLRLDLGHELDAV